MGSLKKRSFPARRSDLTGAFVCAKQEEAAGGGGGQGAVAESDHPRKFLPSVYLDPFVGADSSHQTFIIKSNPPIRARGRLLPR